MPTRSLSISIFAFYVDKASCLGCTGLRFEALEPRVAAGAAAVKVEVVAKRWPTWTLVVQSRASIGSYVKPVLRWALAPASC